MSREELPTEEQFLTLSRRGLVAFAARCLRRVQTLPGYQDAHQEIAQTVQVLWQFPEDRCDQPDMAQHRGEIERHWNERGFPFVVIACETALQSLSEPGSNAPQWAHDLAVTTDTAALEVGHDISDLIRSDFRALSELAPGPFPEVGEPFDETELELACPLWGDRSEPPWSKNT